MTKKKERQVPILIGDVVEVKDCRKFGLSRNTVRGILIWRPMNKEKHVPQFYCIWLPEGIDKVEQQQQLIMLRKAFRELYPSKELERYDWNTYLWNQMILESDKSHIFYVPRYWKRNITHLASEEEGLIVGDLVLDRRWYIRFTQAPVRSVLAIKYDEAYDMNRVCIENPQRTSRLNFGYWVYPLLRKDVIKISRRNIQKIVEPVPETENAIKRILAKIS